MKKLISMATALVLVLSALFVLSACYVSDPLLMEDLVGTYRLTAYTRKDAGEDAETVDLIAEKGITAYLVVGSEGRGFYVYGDNDTSLTAQTVRIEYEYVTETETVKQTDENGVEYETEVSKPTDKITKITYNVGKSVKNRYPGSGEEALGVYGRNKTLNYHYVALPSLHIDYSQDVVYTQVDRATDLSFVGKALDRTLTAAEYEIQMLDGVHLLSEKDTEGDFVYRALDIRAADKKADYYYALKSDAEPRKEESLDVSYTIDSENNRLVLTIGEYTFYAFYSVNGNAPTAVYLSDGEGNDLYFIGYSRADVVLSDWIAEQLG